MITVGCERLAGAAVGGWRPPCTGGGRAVELWKVGLVVEGWWVRGVRGALVADI